MIAYTKEQILNIVNASANEDISQFYNTNCINYKGTTADTKELFTEVIAEWICDNIRMFDSIIRIHRESSYKIKEHDGIYNEASPRVEEIIAMKLFNQHKLGCLGEVFDYQTPLKNHQSDKAGKIDLLCYDNSHIRIIELKKPNSVETMLRCVIEAFTYLKTIDTQKLYKDFMFSDTAKTVACSLVFKDSMQYTEMKQGRPKLEKLMKLINCEPYYLSCENGKYIVEKG